MHKIAQSLSVILALIGTFLLAFGLKLRPGISEPLRKGLDLENRDLVSPSEVRQRNALVWTGLVLISVAAAIELYVVVCF